MAKINTKEKLKEYVRNFLGEPFIKVEISDYQLEQIIDDVIKKFSEFAYDGEKIKYMIIPLFKNIKDYKLDNNISSVIDLRVSNSTIAYMDGSLGFNIPNGYVPNISNNGFSFNDYEISLAKLSKFENLFNVRPNYTFNSNSKIITFHEDIFKFDKALIEVSLEYEPEEVDLIYNHSWIKDMVVAQSKIQWGTNIGKHSATLINGATVNWSEIKSEGQEDRDRLNEELLTRWSPPLGITVG